MVQDFFAKWGKEGIVDLKEQLTELIILTASRTLLGSLLPRPFLSNPAKRSFPYLPRESRKRRRTLNLHMDWRTSKRTL